MSSISAVTETRPMSGQMRAVLAVFTSDQHLWALAQPFVDLSNESIDWESLLQALSSPGHTIAAKWAFALWTDHPKPDTNYFEDSFSMDARIQAGVLRALAVRWGIKA